ncbi:MAG TPA: 2-phospho-L-lactate transferase [Solirubrobacteraceae bacterium]|nr:2-phospho-L-lactate transferase [Solirubrobacteraceae bacterium]
MSAPGRDVVLLSGGTGGAKLALGLAEELGPERLAVIANTADDIEIYGALVSPDPDLVSFWLAGLIDERGWGLRDDTFAVMDALRELGEDVWFNLGDRDLAWCARRSRLIAEGQSATEALATLNGAISQPVPVLPMCEEPVRTWVSTPRAGPRPFQEFMIRGRAEGPLDGLEYRGAELSRPTAAVTETVAAAKTIVIGPSNPLASIGPILAVPGLADALSAASAPVIAVSPIVGGEVLKGPTAAFMELAGRECSAAGVREHYGELLDGFVTDEELASEIPSLVTETRMDGADARRRLARATVEFAATLG